MLLQEGAILVHLFVSIGGDPAGPLVFQLEARRLPKACGRFLDLLYPSQSNQSPTYVRSLIHRVVPGGWAQGGVVPFKEKLEAVADESFAVAHDRPGVIGFANEGPHSSTAQLYITFAPQPALDTKFVAFGRLVDGLDVLRKIEGVETDNGRPLPQVKITAGGNQFTYGF
mmetsp:Transcript_22828/g.76655  ORF Transcript_22828/g.76655 Transcript_22828/m.76655 type:complete len:170 (+) Transcript_22828:344-853(+)